MQGIDERSPLGNRILHLAQKHNISDFYITPWEQLSYRMNGELVVDSFIYQPEQNLEIRPGTLDYAMQIGALRFRALKAYLEAENGLFLICGATGSGKSTTIASMIKARAERRREHIITFEDPIEYILPTNLPSLITQREIGSEQLLFDEHQGRRFPIHEVLFPYDSVAGMIRRGDFKRLDHELETGTTKGMMNFEHSRKLREFEGWRSSIPAKTGYTEHEVAEYLHRDTVLTEQSETLPR
jgi:Tfp pilus assembly pilus retraction ATPase PilT